MSRKNVLSQKKATASFVDRFPLLAVFGQTAAGSGSLRSPIHQMRVAQFPRTARPRPEPLVICKQPTTGSTQAAVATAGSAPLKVPPFKPGGQSRVGEYVSSAQTRVPASKEIQNPRKTPTKTNFTISRSFTTRSANTPSTGESRLGFDLI
jgi:hypothetical protein